MHKLKERRNRPEQQVSSNVCGINDSDDLLDLQHPGQKGQQVARLDLGVSDVHEPLVHKRAIQLFGCLFCFGYALQLRSIITYNRGPSDSGPAPKT